MHIRGNNDCYYYGLAHRKIMALNILIFSEKLPDFQLYPESHTEKNVFLIDSYEKNASLRAPGRLSLLSAQFFILPQVRI